MSTKDNIEIEVAKLADKLCKETAASSLSLTKAMIDKVQSMDMQDSFDYAAEQNAKARETEECKKGIAAFLNKEKINW
ncbi:MAG: methylglutaconyl-CoA hydratase [Sphingobacteriales bacterium]